MEPAMTIVLLVYLVVAPTETNVSQQNALQGNIAMQQGEIVKLQTLQALFA